ncbi:MAG: fumarylacetoacetate hydrolase family protein [Novosphingobium sp.]
MGDGYRSLSNYQFEAKLVIAIGKQGAKVTKADALALVFGYAVELDMTRRDRCDHRRNWHRCKSSSAIERRTSHDPA